MPTQERADRRVIATYLGQRALAPGTTPALESLGYTLVPSGSLAEDASPVLHLVDERNLERLPETDGDPDTPVVLLTGARPVQHDEPRLAARLSRPAALQELFPILQRALEQHPRSVPRVRTRLPARCIRADRRWPGALLSLSEGGCLLHSSEPIAIGARMNLQFALPGGGLITTRGRCVYRDDLGAGIAFSEPSRADVEAIRAFIDTRLAS